jgi:hypothetical protein
MPKKAPGDWLSLKIRVTLDWRSQSITILRDLRHFYACHDLSMRRVVRMHYMDIHAAVSNHRAARAFCSDMVTSVDAMIRRRFEFCSNGAHRKVREQGSVRRCRPHPCSGVPC